jgi:DHA2 family multidrug resistance protein
VSTGRADTGPISVGRRTHHPVCAVGAVLLGSFIVGVHGRLFGIGLTDLRGAFSLGVDEGAWLNTAALAPQILVAPAVAWLATAYGVRRVLAVPSLAYAAISFVIPFVRNYELLVVLHVLHGALLGLFVPATIIVIFRNLRLAWWLPALAVYAFRSSFSLNSGVSLAGWYVDFVGWQWIYWQDVIAAPLMGLLVCLGAPHEPVNRGLVRSADWGGMILLGSGLAMLFAGLDQGNRLDWSESGTVVPLLVGGTALLVAFLVNEIVVREPWAWIGVILSRNVGLALVAAILFTLSSVSNTSLVPNFLIGVGHLRPEQVGPLLMRYGALPLIPMTLACVYLLRRMDPRPVLVVGLSAFAAAALLGTRVTHDWAPDDFVPIVLLQSVGFAFSFLPIIIISVSNLNPARAVAFSAYIQVIRLGGAEIGVAVIGTLLRVREQFHSSILGQHLAEGDTVVTRTLSALTARFVTHGAAEASARGTSSLTIIVQREANVLAYADGFWFAFWAAVAGLVVAAFIGRAPPGPFTPKPAVQASTV